MKKLDAAKTFASALSPDDLVVVCNGMIGRELFTAANRPGNFYMIGSMGLALAIGIGLAKARPERRVIVLDGDGNVLMGMNVLATAGHEQLPNLFHVVLDNQMHASTGGQRTVSSLIALEKVALAVGYRSVSRVRDEASLASAMAELLAPGSAGPRMVLAEVEGGTTPGIARVEPGPRQLADGFAAEARR
jgi:sulfopyruvate decarboxylase subunit beta